jgi:DNA-binding response OmpR family regulator
MRLLIVEDDAVLRDTLQRSLTAAGHRVDVADRLDTARHLWRVQPFDAVLLDLNLPDGSGLSVLREARARGDHTPVLVLTARNRTEERIDGLDAGADDYLGKPFDLGEVEARLRALVRRALATSDRPRVGALSFDRRARRFERVLADGGAEPLELRAREFEVLAELISPPGRVVSKRELSDKLSGFDEALGDNALEAFVLRLRRRLVGSGARIRTLRGLGYVLEPEADAGAGSDGASPP